MTRVGEVDRLDVPAHSCGTTLANRLRSVGLYHAIALGNQFCCDETYNCAKSEHKEGCNVEQERRNNLEHDVQSCNGKHRSPPKQEWCYFTYFVLRHVGQSVPSKSAADSPVEEISSAPVELSTRLALFTQFLSSQCTDSRMPPFSMRP